MFKTILNLTQSIFSKADFLPVNSTVSSHLVLHFTQKNKRKMKIEQATMKKIGQYSTAASHNHVYIRL